MYNSLLTSVTEYRLIKILIEDLSDCAFPHNGQLVAYKTLNAGCYFCPRVFQSIFDLIKAHEEGDVHISMDGTFGLSRWKNASKAYRIPDLVPDLRKLLLNDFFIDSKLSKDCTTINEAKNVSSLFKALTLGFQLF